MPTEVFLPDCFLECYQFLYPTIDFSNIHFYDGMPYPFSLGGQQAITLTWGFGSGIHIYMKSGVWTPCDQTGNGFEAFLILAHELVQVLQIMNLPDPELWIPNYLGHYVRTGFNWDCRNDLEKEAYDHANGCPSPKSVLAAAPGAVTVVARKPNHLDIFWVGPDGAVWTTWWDAASG